MTVKTRREIRAYGECLCTLEEIAAELCVTRQGAAYIEAKEIRKCKKILEKRGFTFADLVPASRGDAEYD